MPGSRGIKAVRRKGSAFWYARGTVRGEIVNESTGTADKDSADAYCSLREAEIWKKSVFGSRATVTFGCALESFSASNKVSPSDAKRLVKLAQHFGNTKLDKIDQEALDRAYQVLLPPGASNANKLRSVLAPLRAVLNHAARRKWCDVPKFEIPAQPRKRIVFMRPPETIALIQYAAPHLRPLISFLLLTGARMSEALELKWQQVDLFGGTVHFLKTKNGGDRLYNMPPAAIATLSAIPHRTGNVFLTPEKVNKHGRIVEQPHPYYNNGRQAGGQIKTGWNAACRRAGLPGHWHEWTEAKTGKPMQRWESDFSPHDLRHTWATWHYCLHKDMLRLRNEGGWDSMDAVEIYAHKIPDAYRPQIEALHYGMPLEVLKEAQNT